MANLEEEVEIKQVISELDGIRREEEEEEGQGDISGNETMKVQFEKALEMNE